MTASNAMKRAKSVGILINVAFAAAATTLCAVGKIPMPVAIFATGAVIGAVEAAKGLCRRPVSDMLGYGIAAFAICGCLTVAAEKVLTKQEFPAANQMQITNCAKGAPMQPWLATGADGKTYQFICK